MRLEPADRGTVEETLFRYLLSLRDGQAPRARLVTATESTLQALYSRPQPALAEALRHCLDTLLVELDPDPACWGPVQAPVAAVGVALAAQACLAPRGGVPGAPDPAAEFAAALVATLPPARDRDAALAYHAVLRHALDALDVLPPARAAPIHALVERSPISALWRLDAHTPAALEPLAAELLKGWRVHGSPAAAGWRDAEDWLAAVERLLEDPRIARWLRHRWLTLTDARPACRNLGLLLEALRRRGGPGRGHRDLLLHFYEAFDYFRGEPRAGAGGRVRRTWPLLAQIERLLCVSGDGEAAIRVNRWGNELFLLFRPLLEIVREEGVPKDHALLTREFVLALRPLVDFATEGVPGTLAFGQVEFGEVNG